MSSDAPAPPPDEELRFDRAIRDTPAGTPPGQAVLRTFCSRPIDTQYWHVAGKPVFDDCRRAAGAALAPARGAATWARAVLFGLVAAVAGAAVYYAVVAITNFEIGIVSILIGYMVGRAVRKAAGGRGAGGALTRARRGGRREPNVLPPSDIRQPRVRYTRRVTTPSRAAASWTRFGGCTGTGRALHDSTDQWSVQSVNSTQSTNDFQKAIHALHSIYGLNTPRPWSRERRDQRTFTTRITSSCLSPPA